MELLESGFEVVGDFLGEDIEISNITPAPLPHETVVENVAVSHTVGRVIGLLRVLQQDSRLQLWSVLLSDPGQFEFGFSRHAVRLSLYSLS
ncbi:MAG: hypothetical protein AAB222_10535, partial [Candidatus Binatota bacterium]